MLDFGFSEVVVTSMIALVVLGPKRLPGVMRKVGNWMGRARVMARQLSDQLEREINADELMRETQKRPVTPSPTTVPTVSPASPAAHLPPLPPDAQPADPQPAAMGPAAADAVHAPPAPAATRTP